MVYKGPFLKQVIEDGYTPAKDGPVTWELTDEALAAIWITLKGTLVASDICIDKLALSLAGIDVWHGSFNAMHYATSEKAILMNMLLKQHWIYHCTDRAAAGDSNGIIFPLLFGAPYLNTDMALPRSLTNRKKLTLNFDIVTNYLTDLEVDISEVLLPDANPMGFIKQEEMSVEGKGTGDKDLWLQTNWDVLKLLIKNTSLHNSTVWTSTIERAGVEINDFPYGYKNAPWSHLHGELMDELEGCGPVENHFHVDSISGDTGMPIGLESWIQYYGVLDYFFEKNLKWRLPTAGASTAKLKYHAGIDEDWNLAVAEYVPSAKV